MTRLRWWLARRIAPGKVIADPFGENATGVWIVIREGETYATLAVERFRLQRRRSIWRETFAPSARPGIGSIAYERPRGSMGWFVGTLK